MEQKVEAWPVAREDKRLKARARRARAEAAEEQEVRDQPPQLQLTEDEPRVEVKGEGRDELRKEACHVAVSLAAHAVRPRGAVASCASHARPARTRRW